MGFVFPSINTDAAEISFIVRNKNNEDVQKLLKHKGYCKKLANTSVDAVSKVNTSIEPKSILTYSEARANNFWETVDIVITAVGIAQIPSVAKDLRASLEQRVAGTKDNSDAKPVIIVSLENGEQPAYKLLDCLQRGSKTLTSDGRKKNNILVPCNAIVDSMCTISLGEKNECLTAYGQAEPNAIVFAPEERGIANTLRSVFQSIDGGEFIVQPTISSEKQEYYESLFEHKKAWLVNGMDYLVAAHAITNNHLYPCIDEQLSETMLEMGAIAESALRAMCEHEDITADLVVGTDSFLGDCTKRVQTMQRNLKDYEKRNCFEAFGDLGKHYDILMRHYNSNFGIFTSPDRPSVEQQRTDGDALTKTLKKIVSLQQKWMGSEEGLQSKKDGFEAATKEALQSCYSSLSLATLAKKIKQRLLILPELPKVDGFLSLSESACDKRAEDNAEFAARFQASLTPVQQGTLFYALGLQFDAIAYCTEIPT